MRLVGYPTMEVPPAIRPAPAQRDWMDRTPLRFAYRCLPLVIANSHGWELLVDRPFSAFWTGGSAAEDVQVYFPGEVGSELASSHFGSGVLTFRVGYLFETEEGYNLWITGPVNAPKDGIAPLSGIVETDWMPYTFTMNWRFTRPGTVRFEAGEPFCHFFPVPRHLASAVEPELHDLDEAPEKAAVYRSWRASRDGLLERLKEGRLEPTEEVWGKDYLKGQSPGGEVVAPEHDSRLVIKPFADRRRG